MNFTLNIVNNYFTINLAILHKNNVCQSKSTVAQLNIK